MSGVDCFANIRTGIRFTAGRYLVALHHALSFAVHPSRLSTLLLMAVLAGCGTRDRTGAAGTVDDAGRAVHVPSRVERLVTLAPSVTEFAFAAGAGPRVVGVTDADDFPPEVSGLPRIQALPVDFEAVVSLEPDLVLASDQVNDPRDADRLGQLGIPAYVVGVHSLDDVFRVLIDLGDLLGTPTAARARAASMRARLETVEPPAGPGPPVLVLIGDKTPFAFGRGSYVHDMVRRAGGRSVTETFDTPGPILSDEFVIESAPDVIVGAFGADYDVSGLLDLHPQWETVPAFRRRQVYSVDPDLILRPGPRLVDGVEMLARVLAADAVNPPGS